MMRSPFVVYVPVRPLSGGRKFVDALNETKGFAAATKATVSTTATTTRAPTVPPTPQKFYSSTSMPLPAAAATTPTGTATATTASTEAEMAPPKSLFGRIKYLIKENGMSMVALYVGFWVIPGGIFYETFLYHNNWGHNPNSILEYLHIKDTVFNLFGLPPEASFEPWQISAIYAYLGAEILEPIRFGAALWLAPKLKRLIKNSRGAGA